MACYGQKPNAKKLPANLVGSIGKSSYSGVNNFKPMRTEGFEKPFCSLS